MNMSINILSKVKSWTIHRHKTREEKEFVKGYDWAAGVLLRGEETPMSIESYMYAPMWTKFDSGALVATEKLIGLEVIKDDRPE